MSDVVALVAVITGAAVGIAGLAFNFWNSSREREQRLAERREDYKEWYSRTLFEKRLAAVQEGYAWLMKFNVAINRASGEEPASDTSGQLRDISNEARDWCDKNTLFIYDGLPSASPFIALTNATYQYASGRATSVDTWKAFNEAEDYVRQRAGRLPEVERGRVIGNGN